MEVPFDPSQQQNQPNPLPASDPLFAALQSPTGDQASPQTQTTPAPQPQQQQSPSVPTPRPILFDLIKGLVSPRAVSMDRSRPTSRVAVLENFLGDFLGALGQGMSVAKGPGAAIRGAGAAIGAPYQQDLQRFQLQQQANETQARIGQQQAETQLTDAQLSNLPVELRTKLLAASSQPRVDPNTRQFIGMMNDAQYQAYLKGQGAANVNALSKQAQADLAAGKVAKYLPTPDGRYLALDAKGNPLHVVDGTIDPAMMQRFSSTQRLVSDGAGGYLVVPVTTTSGVAGVPQQSGQTGLQQLQQKVPGLRSGGTGGAQPTASGPRHIYTNASVIAVDPKTNERLITTASDAAQKGYTNAMPVKNTDVEKFRESQVQFNDVELKLDRYLSAAKSFNQLAPATQGKDQALINQIINKAGAFDLKVEIGAGGKIEIPGLSSMLEAMSRETNSAAYSSLSDEGKELINGYSGSLAAVPAFVKALTNTGRSNKEVMDLELAQIPNPTMAMGDIARKMLAFKENVTQGATGIPRIPGIPTLDDIRKKFQAPEQLPQNIQQLITRPWGQQ